MLLLPIGLLAPVAGALLDGIGASLALSTRRLRTAYAGPAIRVRRGADSLQLDIGFDGAGNLDAGALLAHCGAGSGFVAKWYDQAGVNDLAQATAASQPRIVNAGVVELLKAGGRACPRWTGGNLGMAATFGVGAAALSVFGVGSIVSFDNTSRRLASFQASGDSLDYSSNSSAALLYALNPSKILAYRPNFGGVRGSTVAAGPIACSVVFNGATALVRANGVTLESVASTGTFGATGTFTVGNHAGNEPWIGPIGEVIVQASAGVADRAAIEASQKLYWGTP